MKKIFCVLLALIAVCVFSSCGNNEDTNKHDLDDDGTKNADGINEDSDSSDNGIVNDDGVAFEIDLSKKGSITANAEGIGSNIITLYGKTYDFPVKVSDLLNDGWHFSENVSFNNEFKPGKNANLISFYLYDSEGNEISLESVYNDSQKDAGIEDCLLTGISVSIYKVADEKSWIIPGGINSKSMASDIISVYGNPNNNSNFKDGYNLEKQLTYNDQNDSGISYSFLIVGSDYEEGQMLYGLEGYIEEMTIEYKQ